MAAEVLELGLLVPQHVGKLEDRPEVRMTEKFIKIAHGDDDPFNNDTDVVQSCEMNTGSDECKEEVAQLRVASKSKE